MLILSIVLIAALVAEDQLIKLYIVQNVAESYGAIRNYYTFEIGDFSIFSITHIRNNGAGWSILGGKTVFLVVFTSLILAAVIVYMVIKRRSLSKLDFLSLSLITAGGLGNLIDRFRMLIEGTDKFSGVIDYIKLDFIDFPVFNFADCCVTLGAILFCISVVVGEINDQKRKKAALKAAAERESAPETEDPDGEV